jgi:hypothetical protein
VSKVSARSVRVDDDSYRLLVQHSRAEDRPISRVLRAAVAAYQPTSVLDERAGATPRPLPPPGLTTVGMQAECPHPDETRRVLKWGTVCGRCGGVLR